MLVCAGHARSAFFADFATLPAPSNGWSAFYLLTSMGHESVLIFFVLSGFFVGGSVMRSRSFNEGAYMVARLSRLWVVLLPALAFTLLLDRVTAVANPALLSAHDTWNSLPAADAFADSAAVLLGNALFLHTLLVPVFGSNGPLWSLANEFWYYVIFPALVLPLGGARLSSVLRIGLAAVFAVFASSEFVAGFAVWMLGAMASTVQGHAKPFRTALIVLSLPVFAALVVGGRHLVAAGMPQGVVDLLLGVPIACAICGLSSFAVGQRNVWRRISHRLSDISYSMYASHFPFLVMTMAIWGLDSKSQPGLLPVARFGASLAMMCVVAWIFWFAFERHTATVRSRILGYYARMQMSVQHRLG